MCEVEFILFFPYLHKNPSYIYIYFGDNQLANTLNLILITKELVG